jgi:ubiquinone/menaquinone biosynthesis C-methylase UbiE
VIAVDHSPRMLDAARAKAESEGLTGVELRLGDAGALPLADGEVDAALAHMVLQYLASPAEALREMARAVRPGGSVVAVDFEEHEHEWMRQELGVSRLGFAAEIRAWHRRRSRSPASRRRPRARRARSAGGVHRLRPTSDG